MPRYVLVWDVRGRVHRHRFEARNDADARERLREARELAPSLRRGATRFAVRTHAGQHVAGWCGEMQQPRPRQLRLEIERSE